jgi:membrane protein implicated in regulation of membrane protease activity
LLALVAVLLILLALIAVLLALLLFLALVALAWVVVARPGLGMGQQRQGKHQGGAKYGKELLHDLDFSVKGPGRPW